MARVHQSGEGVQAAAVANPHGADLDEACCAHARARGLHVHHHELDAGQRKVQGWGARQDQHAAIIDIQTGICFGQGEDHLSAGGTHGSLCAQEQAGGVIGVQFTSGPTYLTMQGNTQPMDLRDQENGCYHGRPWLDSLPARFA